MRRATEQQIAPDAEGGGTPGGEWTQLAGAAYDRKIYSLEIETSEAQDQRLIDILNARTNHSHFNLLLQNCADFARGILNTYYRHATHAACLQIAKSLVSYSRSHPDLQFPCFTIAQVPGTLPRSGAVRGVFESFLRSKKYVLPAAALHPPIAGGMAIAYLCVSQPAAIMAKLQPRATYFSQIRDSALIAGRPIMAAAAFQAAKAG